MKDEMKTLFPKVVIKKTANRGKVVFATRGIKCGETILKRTGKIMRVVSTEGISRQVQDHWFPS